MADFVTVYTDASLCIETKCGGWACWIKYDDGKTLRASAPFKSEIEIYDSTHAELMAIANALVVVNKKICPQNSIIVVVTDSLCAIDVINDGRAYRRNIPLHKRMHEIGKQIRDCIPDGCQLRMKKVKAHSNKDGRRSYVNAMVDHHARSSMRGARRAKKA